MKKYLKILSLALAIVTLTAIIAGCDVPTPAPDNGGGAFTAPRLNMNSDSLKQEVTVKTYIDGDTTHFNVPESVIAGGVLKARYLGVNTPESTGKIEEWGKAASNFTKEKLKSAQKILVESDDGKWNADSTGGRYLVWVWYKTAESEDYVNLNVELLANGLAIASNSANNRYGDICMAAISAARAAKLHVYSGEKDPNFPYGQAQELTLRELRTHVTDYEGAKVAFEGVVTKDYGNTIYVEELDEETGMYYGISIYYGYGLNGSGLEVIAVGNRVRIVGTVQYYETGDSYQVSGLQYIAMRPNDPNNIQKLGEGFDPAFVEIDLESFRDGKVTIEGEEETTEIAYAELLLATSVSLDDLRVKSVYMTENEDSSQYGALTITCEAADGKDITVRTAVLYGEDGKRIEASEFEGKTIDVKGIVDKFSGEYQIKVFSVNDILIK